jgi:hypothetical protein
LAELKGRDVTSSHTGKFLFFRFPTVTWEFFALTGHKQELENEKKVK